MRYVIEGMWRGYVSSQDHVCHREVFSTRRAYGGPFVKTLRKLHSIPFSDGTALIVSVREAKPCERVIEKHGYTQLIRDAVYAEMKKNEEMDARQVHPQDRRVQVRADGERPIRVERQESQTDALSVRDTSQDDLALLSPYTLEHDEARIAALDDACGVNDEECR